MSFFYNNTVNYHAFSLHTACTTNLLTIFVCFVVVIFLLLQNDFLTGCRDFLTDEESPSMSKKKKKNCGDVALDHLSKSKKCRSNLALAFILLPCIKIITLSSLIHVTRGYVRSDCNLVPRALLLFVKGNDN